MGIEVQNILSTSIELFGLYNLMFDIKAKLKLTILKNTSFKGNKSYLPSKICSVCKNILHGEKNGKKNWEELKYCSDVCRKIK